MNGKYLLHSSIQGDQMTGVFKFFCIDSEEKSNRLAIVYITHNSPLSLLLTLTIFAL